MHQDEATILAVDLLETAEAVAVTTLDDSGAPDSRTMFNLRRRSQFPGLAEFNAARGETFATFFTTNTSSGKLGQIRRDPRAALLYNKPAEWRSLMLGGTLEIVTDPTVKSRIWQPEWTLYYPGGWADPDHTVLAFRPLRVKYYHQLNSIEFAV